jgi:hypothetical protein
MISLLKNNFKLLVLGAGRGGTSLVGSLLDSHPSLTMALEAHAYDYLVGAHPQAKNLSAKERLHLFITRCQQSAKKAGQTWGNKITTEQLDHLLGSSPDEAMRQRVYKKLLAKRKIVFITRDGRSCVQSKMERTDLDYATAVANWKKSVQWLRFLRQQTGVQLYVVRFEKLLKDPQVQLQNLCAFLGLSFNSQMLKGTASNRIAEVYRQAEINAEKARVPKEAMAYTEDLADDLAYLGYL